jgi:tellurite resistance protein
MAYADGHISEEEVRLLAEMARGMGLEQEEFGKLIERISELDYYIPEDEAEREYELRMAVLTMITDGNIDPREYRSLMAFAERMEIESTYVDQVIDYYLKKQEERLINLGIYKNLYLVAAADGEISPREAALLQEAADTLGLVQEDIDRVKEAWPDLSLMIPEDEDERRYLLENLVYMMMIDGEIDEQEYEVCAVFARSIGVDETQIEAIIAAYEARKQQQAGDLGEADKLASTDVYLDTFNALSKARVSAGEVAQIMQEIVAERDFQRVVFPIVEVEKALFDLIWLTYVRAVALNREMRIRIPLILDLAVKRDSLRELRAELIGNEHACARDAVEVDQWSLAEVRRALQAYFGT